MIVKNPYTEKRHELIRELDNFKGSNEELNDKTTLLLSLEQKEKEYFNDKLNEIRSIKSKMDSKIITVQANKEDLSLNKQYRASCEIYKEIMLLVDKIRSFKKEMRDAIEKNKKKR